MNAVRGDAAFVTRHFGDRSVGKLDRMGVAVLGLETTQAGPLYRVARGGPEELLTFTEVTEFLGWNVER